MKFKWIIILKIRQKILNNKLTIKNGNFEIFNKNYFI